jgi:hypothetical protein
VGDTQQHGLWLIDFTAGDLLHLAFRHQVKAQLDPLE